MYNHLIKVLKKHSTKTDFSESTVSKYFWIQGIKVRVSDHQVENGHDLAIYPSVRGYVCIPNNVAFRKVTVCSNVKQILGIISALSYARSLYAPTADQVSGGKSSFMSELNAQGCYFRTDERKQLLSLDDDVQELLLRYLHTIESREEKLATISSILSMPNSSRRIAALNFKINQKLGMC